MPPKILVVEDNDRNRRLIRIVLKAKGYEVIEAVTAEEAIIQLNSEPIALILMDIQLPKMNGLELTQKIKENPDTKDIPIIALTAYAMKGDKEKFLNSGCDGYIGKPIDTQELPKIVAKLLGD
ncbi:TPA: response regulator [Candidatus Poribacteria bacterium]|nr:response regulator [Candidatus Poribacteria bacterium]